MPWFIVKTGTIKHNGRTYAEGEEIFLLPRDALTLVGFLKPKKSKYGKNGIPQYWSLWHFSKRHMQAKCNVAWLRKAMKNQMGFQVENFWKIPKPKLIQMIIEKRGY